MQRALMSVYWTIISVLSLMAEIARMLVDYSDRKLEGPPISDEKLLARQHTHGGFRRRFVQKVEPKIRVN